THPAERPMRNSTLRKPTPSLPRRRRWHDREFSGLLARLRPWLEVMEDRTLLSTFLVNNTGDSGAGSLRQAILDANAKVGSDIINFDIPGGGVHTIEPASDLPEISELVLIDGWSQPGHASPPLIELSGQSARYSDGLIITGSGTTVRGLAINGFASGAGILITGSAATGDAIEANDIGTDPTGSQARPDDLGIQIVAGAHDNLVGGTSA